MAELPIIEIFGFGLMPSRSGLKICDIISCSCFRVGELRTSTVPLSSDPLTYICRTVSEFDTVGFAEGKKPHGFAIHENDLREIDGHSALLPSEQFSQRVHLLRVNPATHAQDHKVFSTDNSVDSAAHCVALGQLLSILDPSRAALIKSGTLEVYLPLAGRVMQQRGRHLPSLPRLLLHGRTSGRVSPRCGSRGCNRCGESGRWPSDW